MDRARDRRNDEGLALMLATIFLMVATILLSAISMRVIQHGRQVDVFAQFRECMFGAETAVAFAIMDLEEGGDGAIGIGTWEPPELETPSVIPPLPDFDDDRVAPESLPSMPRVEFMALTQHWADDGLDNNGDGIVDDPAEDRMFTIYGLGREGSVVRTIEVMVRGDDVSIWRNAVFAGSGQTGGLINGNVGIRGSVHLLGDELAEGVEAVTAIDMSGTSLIRNNYLGLPTDLRERIPEPPRRIWNGENVETLDATLRVKRGLVGMSGNSKVGEPDVSGNDLKETLDGTYVTDGWSGNSVIDDGDRGDPTMVQSDNGWDEPYDLGDRVSLPFLADDWREMGTGERLLNPWTGSYFSHEHYFDLISGIRYPGNLTINCAQNFYYNASRPLDPNPANRTAGDDYILFNAATNVLEVNGQIEVNGNLSFVRGKGNDDTIHYTGRAAILAQGDVTIATDLLAQNADGSTVGSFPANNILGIMATGDMILGSASQLRMMGAFYAQGTVRSAKQTITVGTMVGNYFDMGTNVPEIYQVPPLADNLPYGMIGAYPILVYSRISWRELGG